MSKLISFVFVFLAEGFNSSVVVTEKHYGHFSWMDLRDAIEQIDGVIERPVATRVIAPVGNIK